MSKKSKATLTVADSNIYESITRKTLKKTVYIDLSWSLLLFAQGDVDKPECHCKKILWMDETKVKANCLGLYSSIRPLFKCKTW